MSQELNKIETKQENKRLNLRRQVIENGTVPNQLRIRNLTLQICVNDDWKVWKIPEKRKATKQSSDWLPKMLTFIVHSILELKRRMFFRNFMLN